MILQPGEDFLAVAAQEVQQCSRCLIYIFLTVPGADAATLAHIRSGFFQRFYTRSLTRLLSVVWAAVKGFRWLRKRATVAFTWGSVGLHAHCLQTITLMACHVMAITVCAVVGFRSRRMFW